MATSIPNKCTSIDISTNEAEDIQNYKHKANSKIHFLDHKDEQFTSHNSCDAERNECPCERSPTNSDASNFILKMVPKTCEKRTRVTHTFYVVATTAFIALLFYFIKSQTRGQPEEKTINIRHGFNAMHLNGLSVGGQLVVSLKDWDFLENLSSVFNSIQFTVKRNRNLKSKCITATVENGAVQISGRPDFCHTSGHGTPIEMTFKNISYVHLNDMKNCHNYAHLILTKWHFPQVREIKLEKVILHKNDFLGLTQFIDRHNESLHKVEIDDSYICESPDCDAGMIEFPNHAFKLKITRSRKSPKWS